MSKLKSKENVFFDIHYFLYVGRGGNRRWDFDTWVLDYWEQFHERKLGSKKI